MAPDAVAVMRKRWTEPKKGGGFGNRLNRPLEQGFELLDEVFEENIRRNSASISRAAKWVAVPIACGAGKSQFTICKAAVEATMSPEHQRGFLIVKGMKSDIEDTAAQINALAEKLKPGSSGEAGVYHSGLTGKAKVNLCDLRYHSTLCITHNALLRALGKIASGEDAPKWEHFLTFGDHGKRSLIVVDECISPTMESALGYFNTHRLVSLMEGLGLDKRLPESYAAFVIARAVMKEFRERAKNGIYPDRTMAQEAFPNASIRPEEFYELQEAFRAEPFYGALGHKDYIEEQRAHDDIDDTIAAMSSLTRSPFWTTKVHTPGKGETGQVEVEFLTSKLLLPPGVSGVILDATCGVDPRYKAFGVEVVTVPPGARDYTGVKLHIATGRAGKTFMQDNATKQMDLLMSDLVPRFEGEAPKPEVFVAVHKGVRKSLKGFLPDTFNMSVGHFGEISGVNVFRDCSVAVLAGNPFKPKKWASQQVVAAEGPPSNDGWTEHNKKRDGIIEGVLAADLIQAASRISIRRVTRDNGGTDPARIFMVLPDGELGTRMKKAVVEAFPGIDASEPWNYLGAARRTVKRTQYEAQLIEAILDLKVGARVRAQQIRRDTGIREEDFKALLRRIRKADPEDAIVQAMKKTGVAYETGGTKGGVAASFVRR